jgi:dihydrofolate reductase
MSADNNKDSAGRRNPPRVHIIACTDSDNVIAVDGALSWAFRAAGHRATVDILVKGAPVIVGARSTSVFGGASPGARAIILSRNGALPVGAWPRAHVAQTPQDALAMCADDAIVYVLGGVSTFAAFMPYAAVVHRIVVTRRGGCMWPTRGAIVRFPWLGRAKGMATVCDPPVAGRGGCSYVVCTDTLAPVDSEPPLPPGDPFDGDDPELERAEMIGFYEDALRSATATPPSPCWSSSPAGASGPAQEVVDIAGNCTIDTDDLDWYGYEDSDGDNDSDNDYDSATDSDEGDRYTSRDAVEDDSGDSLDDLEQDNVGSLCARRPTPWSGPKRPPRGCMVSLLGHCDVALAAAVVARLDRRDLLSLWHASPRTRTVLVDVLTTGPASPCRALVHIGVAGRLCPYGTTDGAICVCPRDESPLERAGAASLWLNVLPRLESKCALAVQTLCHPATSLASPFVDYEAGTLERVATWAAVTRCGAALNVCLALADSLSAASMAYNRSEGFVRRAAGVGPVSAWLADAMNAQAGQAADLANSDVWLPAIGLASAAGRLHSDLLLTLACQVAATNLVTGRRFAEQGRQVIEPVDPDERKSIACAKLLLALVCGLDEPRRPCDPPLCIDVDVKDEREACLLERIASDGMVDCAVRGACTSQNRASSGPDLVDVCRRLRDISTNGSSRKARAAGALLARVFVIAAPIDLVDGWRPRSWTVNLWSDITPTLARADVESFWTDLNPSIDPTPPMAVQHEGTKSITIANGTHTADRDGEPSVSIRQATGSAKHSAIPAVADGCHGPHPNETDDSDHRPNLLDLFDHEIDLCIEVTAGLPPWDLVSLATASRRAFHLVWAAVNRISLDGADGRLAAAACGASVAVGNGLRAEMKPAPDADFFHALGAFMLVCHRMPRMEMTADDVEALDQLSGSTTHLSRRHQDDYRQRLGALERDPNLPAALEDTAARAVRLNCGAALVRCLDVARRMEDVVLRRRTCASALRGGLDRWLSRQAHGNHQARAPAGPIPTGAWLSASALAYIAGNERSPILMSVACSRVCIDIASVATATATFWGAGRRRVLLEDGNSMWTRMSYGNRLGLVVLACLVGLSDRRPWARTKDAADTSIENDADETFLLAVEPAVEFLAMGGERSDSEGRVSTNLPSASTFFMRQLGVTDRTAQETCVASVSLVARFLVAPPGQPLPPMADSVRARIAALLVYAGAVGP